MNIFTVVFRINGRNINGLKNTRRGVCLETTKTEEYFRCFFWLQGKMRARTDPTLGNSSAGPKVNINIYCYDIISSGSKFELIHDLLVISRVRNSPYHIIHHIGI